MPLKTRKRKPRVEVDTSVLVAGMSGFREAFIPGRNTFVWHATEDILDEYKEVLKRLAVRPNLIGTVINLIRESAQVVRVRFLAGISPDPKDDAFCLCAELGKADIIVTLNPKDVFADRLQSKVRLPAEFNRRTVCSARTRLRK